jgi:hypothetical protein
MVDGTGIEPADGDLQFLACAVCGFQPHRPSGESEKAGHPRVAGFLTLIRR